MNTFEDLIRLFNVEPLQVIKMLQQRRLIFSTVRCATRNCRRNCKLIKDESMNLKYFFRCTGKFCGRKQSLTKNTFFAHHVFSPKIIFYIVWCWSCNIRAGITANIVGVCRKSIYPLYRTFREICSWTFDQHPDLLSIGGPGELVQIDLFVGNEGKAVVSEGVINMQWILGMYSTREKRGILFYIPDRSAETLNEFIVKYVKPGTEICTDCFSGYAKLSNLDGVSLYIHNTVNDSSDFSDPIFGIHKNMVQDYYLKFKQYWKRLVVPTANFTPEHLHQFMWMDIYGQTPTFAFNNFLLQISERYPVK